MKSRVKGLFALVIFAFAIAFPMLADGAVVSVDSVSVVPEESFEVGIRISNNTDLISALTVPIRFNNPYLTVDSVSFANSILPGAFRGVADINNTTDIVRVSYIPDQFSSPLPTISNASGLIGTIHFSLAPGVTPGITAIDSVYSDSILTFGGNEMHFWVQLEFSDQTGLQVFLPDFEPGAIEILIATDIGDENNGLLPTEFSLGQNYPNPFNPSTTIEYALPRAGFVSLKIYNVIGQEIATLIEGNMSAGVHSTNFNGINQPSGVYFYKLLHEDGAETKKMMMVK